MTCSPSGETLDTSQTSVPLELDEIYENLDKLNVALGPTGANRNGALSDLLEVTAANFGGQGEKFNETITNFGKFSQTLSDNREEFFGSMRALQGFVSTLARNDQTVRDFNQSLSQVSTVLEGEREELSAALGNLGEALGQVSTFVRDNEEILGRNIEGLNRFTKVLAKQRDSLDQILNIAPTALNNLALTYNPQAGTLDTRSNMRRDRLPDHAPTRRPSCAASSTRPTPPARPATSSRTPSRRSGAFLGIQGKNARWKDQFDPTLGGLVEVTR